MKTLLLKAPKETADDVDSYVDALRSADIDAEGLEVLSFRYINQELLREKVSHPESYSGFVFTSPRGVVAVSQCLDGKTFDKFSWSALQSYVVGEGTARVVWEKLGLTCVGQETGSAQQLAQFICRDNLDVKSRKKKPLLFPSAELKQNVLHNTLKEAGILTDVVTSYKTVPHPQLNLFLEEKFISDLSRPDALIFFSPSGVNAVLPHLTSIGVNSESLKMIAIGPTTEAALKERGLPVFATAAHPSPSGLVQAIKAALAQCK